MSPGEIPRVGYYMYVILGVNRGTCRQHLGGTLAAPVRAPKQRGEGRQPRREEREEGVGRDGWVGVALDLELQKLVIRVAAKHHLAKQRRVRRNCSTRGLT